MPIDQFSHFYGFITATAELAAHSPGPPSWKLAEGRTAHAQSVRKEITRIRHQRHETALDMRKARQVAVLETQRAPEAKEHPEQH